MSNSGEPPDKGGNLPKKRRQSPNEPNSNQSWIGGKSNAGMWLVFETVENTKKLGEFNIFVTDTIIKEILPSGYVAKDNRRLKNGNVLVHAVNAEEAKKALGTFDCTRFNMKIKVEAHKTLNSVRGKIYCPELSGMTEDHILNMLKPQNVIEVRSFKRMKDGVLTETGVHILTFQAQQLPETIKVGYLLMRVETFYDNPKRCFKCQKYGHTQVACKSENEICRQCGQAKPHDNCGPVKCVNCGGDHPTNDPKCASRKQAELTVKIMTDHNIPYGQAKKMAQARLPTAIGTDTFAEVVKGQSTQSNSETVSRKQFDELLKRLKVQEEIIDNLRKRLGTKNPSQNVSGLTQTPSLLKSPSIVPGISSGQLTTIQNHSSNSKPSRSSQNQSNSGKPPLSGQTIGNTSNTHTLNIIDLPGEFSDEDDHMDDDSGHQDGGLPKINDTGN